MTKLSVYFHQIQYKHSSQKVVEQVWVLWKLTWWESYFPEGCKLNSIHTFHTCCMIWMEFCIRYMCTVLLSIFYFLWKLTHGRHMKLRSHMFCETVWYFESEESLGKVYVLCQEVQHLQSFYISVKHLIYLFATFESFLITYLVHNFFQEYLINYGYINPKFLQTHKQIPEKEFETALMNFQTFVGLKKTGTLP